MLATIILLTYVDRNVVLKHYKMIRGPCVYMIYTICLKYIVVLGYLVTKIFIFSHRALNCSPLTVMRYKYCIDLTKSHIQLFTHILYFSARCCILWPCDSMRIPTNALSYHTGTVYITAFLSSI